ncbi:MAG: nitroreductase family protein [Bacteroidota bacterium]
MDILRSLYNRRSSVVFSEKLIEQKKIHLLFKAASLAPSSMNTQPWRFIFASKNNPEQYNMLYDSLIEENKTWAHQAPLLILSIAELISDYKNRGNAYALHDTGMATAYILLQATEMGLVSHPMGGFDKQIVRKNLEIPEKFVPVAMVAVGYPGNICKTTSDLRERELKPRSRKPLSDIVFNGKFGHPSKI